MRLPSAFSYRAHLSQLAAATEVQADEKPVAVSAIVLANHPLNSVCQVKR